MEVKNAFDIPLNIDEAWRVILDVPRVAKCVPGARLTSEDPDGTCNGEIDVRLGPMNLAFRGRGRIVEQDDHKFEARVQGQCSELKGRGRASGDIRINLAPVPDGTRVCVVSAIVITGSISQFARASGMIHDLATHLVAEFAGNLRENLAEEAGNRGERSIDPSGSVSIAIDDPPAGYMTTSVAGGKTVRPIAGGRLGLILLWRALLRGVRSCFGAKD